MDGPRTFSNFSGGVYAVYVIRGSVDFVFKQNVFPNAVVSAVFFGPATASTATALPATSLLVDTAGCPSCGGGGGLSQVVAETDQNGNLTAYYVRVGDKLLSVMRPGSTPGTWTTRYIHEDALGSVRALTDETGTVVDTRGYEAFGTRNTEAGSDPLSYGFAGEPRDAVTGLNYHRARWMDPRVGRFEGMDSVDGDMRRTQSLHRYVYASDEPVDRVDPSGNDDGVDSEPDYAVMAFGFQGRVGVGSQRAANNLNVLLSTTMSPEDVDTQISVAIAYLRLSPAANVVLAQVASGDSIDISQVPGPAESNGPCGNRCVRWDPHWALEELSWDSDHDRLGRLSPAVVLLHELIHIVNGVSDADDKAGAITDGWEHLVAQQLRDIGRAEKPREWNAPGALHPSSYYDALGTIQSTAYFGYEFSGEKLGPERPRSRCSAA